MEFPHKPPTGYEYWTDDFKKTIKRIWIRNLGDFVYTGGEHPSSVWGFYDRERNVTSPQSITRNQVKK